MIRCNVCQWLRQWIIEPLCGPMLFNGDLSRELDRITAEAERLRTIVRDAGLGG